LAQPVENANKASVNFIQIIPKAVWQKCLPGLLEADIISANCKAFPFQVLILNTVSMQTWNLKRPNSLKK
jgi:hypothetical protein